MTDGPVDHQPVLAGCALAGIASALAETGQHQLAEDLIRSITYPDARARAMAGIAAALARVGHHRRAEGLPRSIKDTLTGTPQGGILSLLIRSDWPSSALLASRGALLLFDPGVVVPACGPPSGLTRNLREPGSAAIPAGHCTLVAESRMLACSQSGGLSYAIACY